jgi:hypothetical protein
MMAGWLLGGSVFTLGWVIYGEASDLWFASDASAESVVTPNLPTPASWSPLLATPSRESLAAVLEKPVFSESRRPHGDRAGVQAAPSDFRLAGLVIADGVRSALIETGTSAMLQRLEEGDDIGGWILVEIALDRIKIRRGTMETEMLLDYAAPAPPIPRRETRREGVPAQSVAREEPEQAPRQAESVETGSESDMQ